jgi:crotonobetainyl-CoA:carnitine CoA-transferase CaiB-like acyl-CoA transferase
VLNLPFRMSGAEVSPGPRVPAVGEHTDEVLQEIGMSDAGIVTAAAK